jgi:hypothetical protein
MRLSHCRRLRDAVFGTDFSLFAIRCRFRDICHAIGWRFTLKLAQEPA